MKAKEEASAIMLLCSHCPKEFRYKSERKRHELSHCPRFQCEICSKKFSFVSALRRHQKQHERTGSVKCQDCHRKFRDDVLLKRHIKYAHKGTFVCEDCKSTFSSELALRTHTKTHKPESERRFKCSHNGCTKSFNFSHHLKHHELTHTNAKQHYCSICGKGFIQSHHLKTHMRSHDPAERLFCEISGCKKKFSTDYARKRHMITHKNKPDSGISSDSNSCDASIKSKEFNEEHLLCATCGETVSQNEYKIHSSRCNIGPSIVAVKDDLDSEEWPDSPFKPNAVDDKSKTESIVERDSNCNMMLSCSIIESENCISTQNDTPAKENDSSVDTKNNNIDMFENNNTTKLLYDSNDIDKIVDDIKLDIVKVSSLTNYNQNEKDMCEGCDCDNICNDKISMYLAPEVPTFKPSMIDKKNVPNIEYGKDGVIKILDTFDNDIVLNKNKNNCIRLISLSTCKDAVGNCLVSNGDGCLCARMMADEDQAMLAQEIDDITPQPNDPV